MKKLTLLLFALFFWTGAWAQNLSQGKYVHLLANGESGVTESSLQGLTNGNTVGDVQLATYDEGTSTLSPIQAFYIDLGEVKELSKVVIYWEGALCTNYSIKGSSTTGDSGSPAWDEDFGTYEVARGTTHEETHNAPASFSTRYIKFEPANNGSTEGYTNPNWTVKMKEFEVMGTAVPVLSSVKLPYSVYSATQGYNINASVYDQFDEAFDGNVTLSWEGSAPVGAEINGKNIVFGAASGAGTYTLKATDDATSVTTPVYMIGTHATAPTVDAADVMAIYSGTYGVENYDGWNSGWEWGYGSRDIITINGDNCVRIHNVGTYGFPYADVDLTVYSKLHFDVYSPTATTGHVKIEKTNINNKAFSATASEWTPVEIDLTGLVVAQNGSRWVDFYFGENSTDKARDILIDNVYFVKEAAVDNEKPVMVSASLASKTHNSATLTLKATDNNSKVKFHIVDAANSINATTGLADQGADFEYTVTGLTAETAYNFTVTAEDAAGNVSDNNIGMEAFTTDAAPTGLELTAGGHTILLQGKHYLDRVTNNWELIVSSTDEMSSLGPCYWTLNSGNANMQDNYTKSSDNKTLTICATSTTKPVLYNNFYVNFVTGGEANFGVVNNNDLTWEESGVESLNVIVSGNTASVTGPVTAADVSTIVTNAGSSAILDLTGATLSESVTINPTNRNAIVVVNGTNRTSDKIANLGETKNVIVYDGTYRRAATGYVIALIDDNNSQPAYDFVIDAQQDGVTYTRTVAAGKWVSYNSPASVAIPAGVTVYKATDATTTSVTFTKQESQYLGANVPVILHNNTNDDVVITSNNDKIDLNLTANPGGAAIKETGITQFGTARLIEADGTQFALQDNNLKLFKTGAKIGAFRVYFTGLSSASGARAIFVDGETTKIGSINANGEINVEDGVYYNLAGQRVQNPKKGIYIINGKKVVLK